MNIDNDELRERIRSAMDVCPRENNCALDEARLNRVMAMFAAQRQALRDEVMAAIGEDYKHSNGQKMVNPAYECDECGAPNLEWSLNIHKQHLRTAISTIFEGKRNSDF